MQAQDTTKIYRIEVPGVDAAIDKIQKLNSEFALLKAVKQEANKALSANPADVDNIERQSKILAENELALKKNTAERKIASKEADVMVKAAQQEAIAHTNTANAAKFASGSYNQLYASYKALVDQYKSTPPSSPLFEKVKADAIAAKQKVDDFNRSLSPDGTLVGEYKTGIINSLHSLGSAFTDVIKTGLEVSGIAIGLTGAFEFLKQSIEEFAASEIKVNQFRATLNNLGRTDAFALIAHQVDLLKAKFDYLNKTDIYDVFRKLIDYGKLTEKQISDLLPVIINFAAKQQIPIQQASDIIVRALEGNQRGLADFGIHLSKTADEGQRLTTVMTALKEKTADAAATFAKSAAGEMEANRQKLVDLREEIGKNLLPLLVKLETFASRVAAGVKPFVEDAVSLFTFGSNGTIKEHFAQRDAAAEQAFNKKARDESIQQEIKDRLKQYEDAFKQGIITKDAAIKQLQARLAKGTDNEFAKQINEGILAGLDPRTLGINTPNEDLGKKERLKRIAEIENDSVKQQIALEKRREAGKVSEKQYEQDLFDILTNAEKRKMAILTQGSTEEIKQANQIQLQLLKDRKTFLDKMFALDQQSVEARKTAAIQQAQTELDAVLNNPLSTNLQKADAQIAFDQKRIDIEKTFNDKMDKLEIQYAKKSEKNEADRNKAVNDLLQKSLKDRIELVQITLNDIDHQTAIRLAGITQQFDILKQNVLNGKGNRFQKNSQLSTLDDIQNIAILTQQLEGDTEKAKAAEAAFKAGTITYEQYAAATDKATQAQIKLQQALDKNKVSITNVKELLQNAIGNSVGFSLDTDQGRSQRQLLGQTIVDTFQTAGNAMNTYFDMEQNRITASNKLTQQRLDIELNQQKARAQSQAERDALDREFQKKKDAADKEAFEKSKKIQIAQAEINLGIQLSNLAVIAFSPNPLNIATLGTAGAIMYAIQAALAIVNFALNVSKIKGATFEKGGELSDVLGQGGEFGGRPHSRGGNKFMFGNTPVETEAGEAYVINKNATQSQGRYTVTGTPRQIASAINTIGGGRPFDGGAIMYRGFEYGGMLGDNLKAPINPSSFLNPASQGNSFEEIKSMIGITHNSLIETNKRIDNIKVHVVTREVESALNKKVKSDKINSL